MTYEELYNIFSDHNSKQLIPSHIFCTHHYMNGNAAFQYDPESRICTCLICNHQFQIDDRSDLEPSFKDIEESLIKMLDFAKVVTGINGKGFDALSEFILSISNLYNSFYRVNDIVKKNMNEMNSSVNRIQQALFDLPDQIDKAFDKCQSSEDIPDTNISVDDINNLRNNFKEKCNDCFAKDGCNMKGNQNCPFDAAESEELYPIKRYKEILSKDKTLSKEKFDEVIDQVKKTCGDCLSRYTCRISPSVCAKYNGYKMTINPNNPFSTNYHPSFGPYYSPYSPYATGTPNLAFPTLPNLHQYFNAQPTMPSVQSMPYDTANKDNISAKEQSINAIHEAVKRCDECYTKETCEHKYALICPLATEDNN